MKGKRRNKIKMPLKKIPKRKQSTLSERINLCHDIGRIELPNNLSALIVSSAQKSNENNGGSGMQMLSIPTTSKKSLANSISIVSNGQNRLSSAMVPPLVSIMRSRSPLRNIASSSIAYSTPSSIANSSVSHYVSSANSNVVYSASKSLISQSSMGSRGATSLNELSSQSNVSMAKAETPSSRCGKTKTVSSILNAMESSTAGKACHSMSSTGEIMTWSLPTQVFHQAGPVQCFSSSQHAGDASSISGNMGQGTEDISKCQDMRSTSDYSDASNIDLISSNSNITKSGMPTNHLHLANIKPIKSSDIIATSLKTLKPLNKSTVTEILHLPNREEFQLDGKSKIYLKAPRYSLNKNSMNDVRLPIVPVRAPLLQPISPETKPSIAGGKRSLLMLKKESGDVGQNNCLYKKRKQEDKFQKENQNPMERKPGSARKNLSSEMRQKGEISDDDDDVIITGVISVNDLERKTLTASRKGNRKDFGLYSTNKKRQSTKAVKVEGNFQNMRNSSLGNIQNISGSSGSISMNDVKSNVFLDSCLGNFQNKSSKKCDRSTANFIKGKMSNDMMDLDGSEMMDLRGAPRAFSNQNKGMLLRQLGDEMGQKKANMGVILGNVKTLEGYNSCMQSESRATSDDILDWKSVLKIYDNRGEEILRKPVVSSENVGVDRSEYLENGSDINIQIPRESLRKAENGSGTDSGAEDDVLRDLREFLMLSEYKNRKPPQENENKEENEFDSLNLKTSESNIQRKVEIYNNYQSKSDETTTQRSAADPSEHSAENNTDQQCHDSEANNQTFQESEYYSSWHSYFDNYPKMPPNKQSKGAHNSKGLYQNDADPMLADTDRYRFRSAIENKERHMEEAQFQAGYIVKSDYGSNAMDMKTFRRLQNKKR